MLLDAVSVWDDRELMILLNGLRVLWVLKMVVYSIDVGTLDRGYGIMNGEYLSHWMVWNGCWCGMYVAYWVLMCYSAKIRYKFMLIRYR